MKPHKGEKLLQEGPEIGWGEAAFILVHGRGSTAQDILTLAEILGHQDQLTYLAPQAANQTWYPYNFLAPIEDNEPGISSGLLVIKELVNEVQAANIPEDKIFIGGFSQGACLALEFIARNAGTYGGVFAFSGGLIGPKGISRNYKGHLNNAPVFIGCSDVDQHIPLERVKETTDILTALGGDVTEKIYPGMGHTINEEEIQIAKGILDQRLGS